MSSLKQLQTIYDEGLTLKMITEAYSEIAAAKLSKTRTTMEANIRFAQELGDLYHLVRVEAMKRKIAMAIKAPVVVHILLTSNNRFYSSLEKPLTKYFITATENLVNTQPDTKTIRIVVGKTGPAFLRSLGYQLPFQSVMLNKDLPDPQELKKLTDIIRPYQTVLVYHSRFKTVLTQLPVVSDITQSLIAPSNLAQPIKYIFEPELYQILQFFETQILQILLEQTFLESDLSRTAARLTGMDEAQIKANDYLKIQRRILNMAKTSIDNAKMLDNISHLLALKGKTNATR